MLLFNVRDVVPASRRASAARGRGMACGGGAEAGGCSRWQTGRNPSARYRVTQSRRCRGRGRRLISDWALSLGTMRAACGCRSALEVVPGVSRLSSQGRLRVRWAHRSPPGVSRRWLWSPRSAGRPRFGYHRPGRAVESGESCSSVVPSRLISTLFLTSRSLLPVWAPRFRDFSLSNLHSPSRDAYGSS